MKGIEISAETANALRELILKSQEAYAALKRRRAE
jgi:hypothetical protein